MMFGPVRPIPQRQTPQQWQLSLCKPWRSPPAPPAGGGRAGRRAGDAGFTLLELLVVLAILGLLVGLVAPRVLNYLGRAKTDTAQINVKNLEAGLELFKLDCDRYPTQEEGLAALVERPPGAACWQGPYLQQAQLPQDPWGRPFVYRVPGQHAFYDVYSLGPEGRGGPPADGAAAAAGAAAEKHQD